MSGATFGRKGMAGGMVPQRPLHAQARETEETDAIAARRAAFLAEESRRAQQQSSGDATDDRRPSLSIAPVLVKEKSRVVAYLLWLFLGGFSAHRFYLGYPISATIQASLLPINWILILLGSLLAVATLTLSGLWILADAFVIPSLYRDANARLKQSAFRSVFA